jgi:hypothetical protein
MFKKFVVKKRNEHNKGKDCSFQGCNCKAKVKGLCYNHYQQYRLEVRRLANEH